MSAASSPNVTLAEPSPAAVSALWTCLRHLLAAEPGRALPTAVGPDDFVSAAARHRVLDLLACREAALHPQVAEAIAQHRPERTKALVLTAELVRVTDVLDAAGVRSLSFKGPVLAHLAYDDITARTPGDLDLLVAPQDVAAAVRGLLRAGWVLDPACPTPDQRWAWDRLLRYYYECTLVGPTSVIDLHWRLDLNEGRFDHFDTLWSRRRVVPLAGRDVATLDIVTTFRHCITHSAKDEWQYLRSLVDLHRLSAQPALWDMLDPGHMRRVDRDTLAVMSDLLGAPSVMLDRLSGRLALSSSSAARHARRSQVRAERYTRLARVPGASFATDFRSFARSATSGSERVRVAAMLILRPSTWRPVDGPTPWRGWRQVLALRLRRIAHVARHGQGPR